ncbi:hypothetical protein [Lentibacillus sp. CBA3610]|nr:hypothetical protein [Lentibacillus sp. CBA3610]
MTKIKLTMLGTGSPVPSIERSASSQLLEINNMPLALHKNFK